MKTAIITFKNSQSALFGDYLSGISSPLFNAGFSVDYLEVLPISDMTAFRRSIDRFKDTVDNLIVVDNQLASLEIKNVIAEVMNAPLTENENALKFVQAVADVKIAESESSPLALLPMEGTLIPNILGVYQGFMLEDREFTLISLPENLKEYKQTCEKYVIPYLENKYGLKNRRLTLKYFGSKKELMQSLENASQLGGEFKYDVEEQYGDFTVTLLFERYDRAKGSEIIRQIVSDLKEGVYAEYDTGLNERLFDILKLKKLKLSVAESFTGGRVVSSVIQNSGASEVVYEGVVAYSNQSKIKRLGVKEEDLKREGAVSSIVAYQMAAGLLMSGEADVSISTTGIAGPKSDDTEKPVGLCYIAVGMKDGVHTYKFNFNGVREEITETAKNTALFLAIKKLKRI